MVRYMKCPRCELNYIDAEKQEYCDVCLKEMKGIPDPDLDLDEAEEELPTELCPVCGENMMRPGEKMCDECRKKAEYEEEPNPDEDDEWREYLDDDTDADLAREMGEMDEELEGEFEEEAEEEEEEETYSDDEEDLEYVTGDEIYTLGDDDDDEDDDDKEDGEDF